MDDLIYHLRGLARAAEALGLSTPTVMMHAAAPPAGVVPDHPGYAVCHGRQGHTWCESYRVPYAGVYATVIVSRGEATPEQIAHGHGEAVPGCTASGAAAPVAS